MKRKKKSIAQPINSAEFMAAQLAQFKPLLDEAEYAALLSEVDKPLPVAFRLNPLKMIADGAQGLARRYGWSLAPIPFCSEGFRVMDAASVAVSATLEHKNGAYYIQEAASMLPVELFNFMDSEEDLTLDLAASPGGKTTHLVARQRDRGLVIANDSSPSRIQALKVVLQHWGATNTAVTRFPGEKLGGWFANTFDRALIDAPCSMQGLRTADSHETRPVTDKESRALAQRQTALLTSALQAVKLGGEVVYSTCTLLPAEDEGVVDAVLTRFKGAVKLVNVANKLPSLAPGIQRVGDQPYLNDMRSVVRLWPHRMQTAGFFACLLQKTDEFGLKEVDPPTHSMEAAGFFELNSKETAAFAADFDTRFGFDLAQDLERSRRVLVRRDQRVFIFPRLLLERFRDLPVQSAGMLLGEWEGDQFIPSQEWVTRFGAGCARVLTTLEDDLFNRFCMGEDIPDFADRSDSPSDFRVVVDSTGRIVGRGRAMSGKLKNLSARQLGK